MNILLRKLEKQLFEIRFLNLDTYPMCLLGVVQRWERGEHHPEKMGNGMLGEQVHFVNRSFLQGICRRNLVSSQVKRFLLKTSWETDEKFPQQLSKFWKLEKLEHPATIV